MSLAMSPEEEAGEVGIRHSGQVQNGTGLASPEGRPDILTWALEFVWRFMCLELGFNPIFKGPETPM